MPSDSSCFASLQRLLRASSFLILAVIGSCADEEESVDSKCERLRQHVVTLRTDVLGEVDRAAHQAALKQALGGQFIADCKALTPKQLSCAFSANDTSSIASCLSDSP